MRLTARNRQKKHFTAQQLMDQADNDTKRYIIGRSLDYTTMDNKYESVRCPATGLWLPKGEFYIGKGSSNLNPNQLRRTCRYAWNLLCWDYKSADWRRANGTKKFDAQIRAVVNEEDPYDHFIPANLGNYLV